MRALLLILLAASTACATPPVQVTGKYGPTLSDTDIKQIKQIVAAHRDLGPTLRRIEAHQRDAVRAEVGRYTDSGWLGTVSLLKRGYGRWYLPKNSLIEATAERTITVH